MPGFLRGKQWDKDVKYIDGSGCQVKRFAGTTRPIIRAGNAWKNEKQQQQ